MTVLLVGCGSWGRNWARTLEALGELGALCDPAWAAHGARPLPFFGIPVYADLTAALAHPGLEAVVIATPAPTHAPLARQCLLAGLPTLVEKPLALTTRDARELVALSHTQNTLLAVGHLLMAHPALITLQHWIRAGELGAIRSIQCTRINCGTVRDTENAWWSLAPHDLSILHMLLEAPFYPVAAQQQCLLGRSHMPDAVTAWFQTDHGAHARIDVSWLSPIKRHETVVIGTRRMAVFEDTHPPETKLTCIDLDPIPESAVSVTRGVLHTEPVTMVPDVLTRQAQAFLSAVRLGTPIPNTAENGLHVVTHLEQVQAMLDQATGVPVPRDMVVSR